jgi:hypothetical protein
MALEALSRKLYESVALDVAVGQVAQDEGARRLLRSTSLAWHVLECKHPIITSLHLPSCLCLFHRNKGPDVRKASEVHHAQKWHSQQTAEFIVEMHRKKFCCSRSTLTIIEWHNTLLSRSAIFHA